MPLFFVSLFLLLFGLSEIGVHVSVYKKRWTVEWIRIGLLVVHVTASCCFCPSLLCDKYKHHRHVHAVY